MTDKMLNIVIKANTPLKGAMADAFKAALAAKK